MIRLFPSSSVSSHGSIEATLAQQKAQARIKRLITMATQVRWVGAWENPGSGAKESRLRFDMNTFLNGGRVPRSVRKKKGREGERLPSQNEIASIKMKYASRREGSENSFEP